MPACISFFFLIVFTNMPLSSAGWKTFRVDVMYVERWSRSLCVPGDAARMSPMWEKPTKRCNERVEAQLPCQALEISSMQPCTFTVSPCMDGLLHCKHVVGLKT